MGKGKNPAFKNEQKGSLEDQSRHNPTLRALIVRGRREMAADKRRMEWWAANDFESSPLTEGVIDSYGGREEEEKNDG